MPDFVINPMWFAEDGDSSSDDTQRVRARYLGATSPGGSETSGWTDAHYQGWLNANEDRSSSEHEPEDPEFSEFLRRERELLDRRDQSLLSEWEPVSSTSESEMEEGQSEWSEEEVWHPPQVRPRVVHLPLPAPHFRRRDMAPLPRYVVPNPFYIAPPRYAFNPRLSPPRPAQYDPESPPFLRSPPVSPPRFDCSALMLPDSDDESASPPVSPPRFDSSAFLMPDSDDESSTVDISEFLS